jgi:hypothetical protein
MRSIAAPAISVLWALSVLVSIANAGAQGPPTPADDTCTVEDLCVFPVRFEVSGKMKGSSYRGRTIFIFPGLTATLTNIDHPENQQTLNVPGRFHDTVLENGDVETVVTGRNFLFDPEAGCVLAIGRFSFVFDEAGPLAQPLLDTGQRMS